MTWKSTMVPRTWLPSFTLAELAVKLHLVGLHAQDAGHDVDEAVEPIVALGHALLHLGPYVHLGIVDQGGRALLADGRKQLRRRRNDAQQQKPETDEDRTHPAYSD